MEVSDSLVTPDTRWPFAECLSVYGAQTELLLDSVYHHGHITRVGIPGHPFISLSLKQNGKT